jgi:mono/diheme cytochrome c family protein
VSAEGKPAMKAPAIKGKSADEIQKQITTSPKHTKVKNLTPAEVKDLAAYLGTLK